MGSAFFKDDNQQSLVDPTGLRPAFKTTGIISATMSGSTQELTIPVLASAKNAQNQRMVTVTTGAQPAFIAFDIAGQSGNYTGITNMMYIPVNWIYSFAIGSGDVSFYVLQAGTAGTIQLNVLQTP